MENETPRGKRQNPVSDTSSGTAWSLKPELVDRPFGEIDRLFDNLEALRIVFSKESGEEISPEEKDRVSLYSGWGGLSRFFSARSPKWDENGDKLISVLTERALSFVDRSSEGLDETRKDRLKYGISSFYTYQDVTKRLLSVAIGREENDDLVDTFYHSAFRSTPTSFYTSASLVLSMWEAVRRTGFSGGRILEPGAGSGIFLGLMPDEIRQGSRTLAIEKDEMTGRVLQFLYGGDPAFDPRIAPFESIKMPAGRFDLVIGNVPFGDVRVFPEHGTFARQSMSIHNFFLLRSSELLRDGGLMMVLTSNYFLDSKTALSRINMDSLGMKLVAPLRLPEEVFATSGTQAGSDLLVFQKNPSSAVRVFPYEKTSQLSLPETTHKGHVNTLFLDNPETVMGQSSIEENRFGDPVMRVSHPGWEKALDDRISAIVPASVYMPSDVIDLPDTLPVGRPGGIPGTMILAGDGKTVLEIDENGTHVPVPLKARDAELLRDLIPLRDILLSIVLKQPDPDVSEEDLVPLRNSLNDRYDNFVRKFGVLSGKTVSRLFSSDPSWPLVAALEIPDLSENRVEKASIFRERTVLPVPRERKAANAMDALTISLDFYGKVVPAYMEKISGQPFDNLKIELEGKIFKQADETWEIADRYLSGNVRKKLEEARILAEEDPSFQSNVDALVSVQPRDLSPSQITVNLGAPWIPEEIIRNFVDELFYEVTYQKPGRFYQASNDRYFSVRRLPIENSWVMAVSKDYRTNRPAMISEYETQRLDFFDLLGDALNQKRPTVYDTDDDGKKIVNPGQTELARERIEKIQEKFAGWIWKDQERAEFLVREYNERFNVWRAPSFDGSHMTFPGMNPRFSMRPHQKDAVFRTLLTGNALYAHVVGAGKTATMIAAAYEQKRLGQFEKPMIIVPNHMLRQFVLEAQRLYPSARILSVSKDDLTKDRRKIFWGKVTMGNWDMVITTHGVFERIKLSPAAEARFLERAVQEYQEFIISLEEGSDREGAASKRSRGMAVKQIAKRLDSFEARLKELKAEEKKDDFPVYFDQMGIRSIFVDEAHYFKGLEIVTKQDRIPGLTGQASQRAFDLFWKTRWIMEQNGGEKGVHFATGTPVANIMAEIFGMQRYLAPRALKQEGVEWFDSWSSMFGQVVSQFELSPEGTGYRKNARFSKYVNVPDLMNMYLQFADVKTANDLDLPTPDVEIQTMAYDRSPFLDRYMKTLAVRAERVRQRGVDPSEDNMLNIMTDARKASISPRFIDPLAVDDPGSKVNGLVENLLRIHRETQSERLTQMVFCDYGTPSKDPGKYSVYDEIRRKLVENGVPDQEIAFIHDASSDDEKEALFQKVRDGAVRVLVGSTLKMGTGTNVQSRLVALHHLDIPWRPADMEQRNGRIARQGNMNDTVQIYVYTTKDSIDVFMLDAVKRKAEFIAQVMKGEAKDRVLDEDDDNMAYQQIMAASTGNDGIRRKIELDQEIQKMERRKQGWQDEKFHAGKRAVALESEIEKLLKEIAEVEKDMDAVTPEEFEMTVGGVVYKSKSEALKPFMERWVESGKHPGAFELGEYAGFRIEKPEMAKSWVRLVRNGVHSMDVMEVSARLFSRIESKIKGFPILLENLKADLKEATGNRKIFLELSEKPFEQEERLKEMKAEQERLVTDLDRLAEELRQREEKATTRSPFVSVTFFEENQKTMKAAIESLQRQDPSFPVTSLEFSMEKRPPSKEDEPNGTELVLLGKSNGIPVFRSVIPFARMDQAGENMTLYVHDPGLFLESLDKIFRETTGSFRISNFSSDQAFYLMIRTDSGETRQVQLQGLSLDPDASPSDRSRSSDTEKTKQEETGDIKSGLWKGIDLAKALERVRTIVGSEKLESFRVALSSTSEGGRIVATNGARMVWLETLKTLSGSGPEIRLETDGKGLERMAEFLRNRLAAPSVEVMEDGFVLSIGTESVGIPNIPFGRDDSRVLAMKPNQKTLFLREEMMGTLEEIPGETLLRVAPSPSGLTISFRNGTKTVFPGDCQEFPVFWNNAGKLLSTLSNLNAEHCYLSVARLPEGKSLPFWSSAESGSSDDRITVLAMPHAKTVEIEAEFSREFSPQPPSGGSIESTPAAIPGVATNVPGGKHSGTHALPEEETEESNLVSGPGSH